jgi:hypothetical protein
MRFRSLSLVLLIALIASFSVWVRLANENARLLNRARLRWLARARELVAAEK